MSVIIYTIPKIICLWISDRRAKPWVKPRLKYYEKAQ